MKACLKINNYSGKETKYRTKKDIHINNSPMHFTANSDYSQTRRIYDPNGYFGC